MRYVLQVVLSNAQHPEYGQATIPFPIPNQNYDSTIELLGPLEIGDTLRQDCQVDELDSFYTVLNTLIGTQVTLDELDYLAKRLDSFDDGEGRPVPGDGPQAGALGNKGSHQSDLLLSEDHCDHRFFRP